MKPAFSSCSRKRIALNDVVPSALGKIDDHCDDFLLTSIGAFH